LFVKLTDCIVIKADVCVIVPVVLGWSIWYSRITVRCQ